MQFRRARATVYGLPALALAVGGLMAGCPTPQILKFPTGTSSSAGTTQNASLTVGGRERTYTYFTPSSFTPGQALPVVVAMHGTAGSGAQFLRDDNWKSAAEANNFIVVAPDALGMNRNEPANLLSNQSFWLATQASTGQSATTNEDVLFFDTLLQDVSAKLGFTVDRVFVTGHSNGGSMAFVLASERGANVRALGLVASHWIGFGPTPEPPTPTLFITGTEDPLSPLTGGAGLTASIDFTLMRWALVQGCNTTPALVSDDGNLRISEYQNCKGAVTFRTILISGQGHTWPGGVPLIESIFGPATDKLDATDTIWQFFKDQAAIEAGVGASAA